MCVCPRLGWCASRATHVCDLNDVFLCVCVFTFYSKQINNYNLILLALAYECVWLCSLAFCCVFFCFLEAWHPFRFLPNRWGPKTGSLLMCVWSVLFLFQHNLFVGKLVPFNCSCRTIVCFCWFLPFRTKIEHLKLLHCLYCFSSFCNTCVCFYHVTNT